MFVHLTTSHLESLFNDTCACLARMNSFQLVIDQLLEGIDQLHSCKKEAILVLSRILLGRKQAKEHLEEEVEEEEYIVQACLPVMYSLLGTAGATNRALVAANSAKVMER